MNTRIGVLHEDGTVRRQIVVVLVLVVSALALLVVGSRDVRAETPGEVAPQEPETVDKRNWPSTRKLVTSGGVTVEIVNRPTGDNVVEITPESEGIAIRDAEGVEIRVAAPLWPDHPRNDEPDADPGAAQVDDANGDGQHVVVLNRPSTTTADGDAHASNWAAWHTTYLEMVANGEPFVECELVNAEPASEECWVTRPERVLAAQSPTIDESVDNNNDGQAERNDVDPGTVSTLAPESPEQRWTGRNYQYTSPAPVEAPTNDEQANPLLTAGQHHEDGSDVVIVNVPEQTDDAAQRESNFDLENETLDALDAGGEPYVVCFPEWTTVDINTGDTVTTPAFCSVVSP